MKQLTIWSFPIDPDAPQQTILLGPSAKPISIKLLAGSTIMYVLHDVAEEVSPLVIHGYIASRLIQHEGPLVFIDTVAHRDNHIVHYFYEDRQP